MTKAEKRRQLKNQWKIALSAMDAGRSHKWNTWQFIGYVLVTILWLVSLYLACIRFWPWLLIAILVMHIAELAIIGWQTGRDNGVSGAKSICMCLLYGFVWWLPYRVQTAKIRKDDLA